MMRFATWFKNHGSLRVLDGVSLSVERGEVAAVIGPSGGGKRRYCAVSTVWSRFRPAKCRWTPSPYPGETQRRSGETLRQLRVASAWSFTVQPVSAHDGPGQLLCDRFTCSAAP